MSFNSTDWTIPELCVWIATRSEERVNTLTPAERDSIDEANLAVPGAWAARDKVILAAQGDHLTVTCRRDPDPILPGSPATRAELSPAFWKVAEIGDYGTGWTLARRCVARANGQLFKDLRAKRIEALSEWPVLPVSAAPMPEAHPSAPQLDPPLPPAKRGPRPKWDWPAAQAAFAAHLGRSPDGLPEVEAEAVRWVADWFSERNADGHPHETEIRLRVTGPVYAAARRETP
jgi:hypothetical protein